MKNKKFYWYFPLRKFFFMRIETFLIALLSIFIFFYVFLQSEQRWFHAVIAMLGFIAIYMLISFIIQIIRSAEEKYFLTPKHFEVIKKTKNKIKKEKVSLKDVVKHKIDKFFLGGYLLTNKGKRHTMFFNTRVEAEEFEKRIKKHLNPVKKTIKKAVKKTKKRKKK